MWPLAYVYGALNWPTFHSWGLLHGTLFSAWPTLSIVTFLLLGYLPPFHRVEDTSLHIAGLLWGLMLTGFVAVSSHLGTPYSLLIVTAVLVAILSVFVEHNLRLALSVIAPSVFLDMEYLLDLLEPGWDELPLSYWFHTFHDVKNPLIFTSIGWAVGSLVRAILKRRRAAASTTSLE